VHRSPFPAYLGENARDALLVSDISRRGAAVATIEDRCSRTQRAVQERIASHEAKARKEEEASGKSA